MAKNELISPGSIPNYKLKKNLQLNGKYLSNDGGDEGISIADSGDVTITGSTLVDYNLDSPGSMAKTVLDVDVDITGAQASSFSIVGLSQNTTSTAATGGFQFALGINNIVTNQLTMDSGAQLTYGINNAAVTNTNGASQCVGIINGASGGDSNTGFIQTVTDGGIDIQLQSSADVGDKFTIATGTHGATTIATIDDDSNQAAHLTFDIEGDILFSADTDGGVSTGICTVDATNSSFVLLADRKIMFGSTGEYIYGDGTNMVMASSGTFLITTSADSGTGALSLRSGAEMNLGSDTGVFNFRDDGDADDAFKITVEGGTGATTLETLSDAADGHMTLNADGDLTLDCGRLNLDGSTVTNFKKDGTTFGIFDAGDSTTTFTLYEAGGSSTDDRFTIDVAAAGATTISTVDAAANAANLTFQIDGDTIIDRNISNTSDGTYIGLSVDTDKTGASTGNNTVYGLVANLDSMQSTDGTNTMYGIYSANRFRHAADAGTITGYGAHIEASGSSNGTSKMIGAHIGANTGDTNIGIQIECTDGGEDIKIKSTADGNDYFTISTTANGATTLATVDGGGTAAHLTLDVAGDIEINADGGDITFKDDTTILGSWDSSGNLLVKGDLIIDDGGSIKEAGGTAAITIDADGEVTKIGQDSPSDGQVLTWDNGNSKVVWSASGGGGGITTGKAIAMAIVFG